MKFLFHFGVSHVHANTGESIGLKFIHANYSEPIRKTFCISFDKNGQKSIRPNPINLETSIRMNTNQSETKFSIRINPTSD